MFHRRMRIRPRVLVVRSDGMVLGADGYQGGPAVLVPWSPDPFELRARVNRALSSRPISRIRRPAREKD